MSLLPTFPSIPTVVDGQTLSASQLNLYGSALRYLLGESRAPRACPEAPSFGNAIGSWWTAWSGWIYHKSNTLHYLFRAKHNGGAGSGWDLLFTYIRNDGGTENLLEISGSNTSWQTREGTIDLSVAPGMTLGRVYRWEIKIRYTGSYCACDYELWDLSERGAISGWATPPTFSAGTSSAAHLNGLRTSINALATLASPLNVPTSCAPWGSNDNLYNAIVDSVLRYRSSKKLFLGLGAQLDRGGSFTWGLKVVDTAGRETDVWSASRSATGRPDYFVQEIDLGVEPYASKLASAGITLTKGSFYRLRQWWRNTTGRGFSVHYAVATVLDDMAYPAAWKTLPTFAHGARTATPANMNLFRDNCNCLYNGAEQLWDDRPAQRIGGAFSIWHRKRWLIYRYSEGNPRIYYGNGMTLTHDLPGDGANKWLNYDLTQFGALPYGAAYYIADCDGALESDEPYA